MYWLLSVPKAQPSHRDKAEQILFDSVSFPVNIPDAEQAFNAISFDDMDGDGKAMCWSALSTKTVISQS